jgi:hypothetical protein
MALRPMLRRELEAAVQASPQEISVALQSLGAVEAEGGCCGAASSD